MTGTTGGDLTVSNTGGSTGNIILQPLGNVGIGTTTPWGRLSIKGAGTGTGKALVITDSSDVERMVVQDNGNVGIGTTGPGAKLNVVGDIAAEKSAGGYVASAKTIRVSVTMQKTVFFLGRKQQWPAQPSVRK